MTQKKVSEIYSFEEKCYNNQNFVEIARTNHDTTHWYKHARPQTYELNMQPIKPYFIFV